MFDYSNLREASWRGISFPVISIQQQLTQDLATHKKVDRDGARIEGTGLNPSNFSCKIPFINTLIRAKNETWKDLFPARFIEFFNAFKDRSTGIFVHPLYGDLKCKPSTWTDNLNGDQRDGIFVDVAFIATTEDDELVETTSNAFSTAKSSANALDTGFSKIKQESSFEDFVNSLTAVVNSGTRAKQKFISQIDSKINALNNISKTVKSTARVFETDPITQIEKDVGPIGNGVVNLYNSSTELSLALFDLKSKIIAKDKDISTYIVPKNMALTLIALKLRNSIEDLLSLNPNLPISPVIVQYTIISYYKK